MKVSPDRLQATLRKGLAPIYLVSGDEPLLVSEARDLIFAEAKDRGFEHRELMVAERGFDWDGLQASTQALGLFAEHRLIDLRLPTGKPGDKGAKVLGELATSMPELTTVVVSVPKLTGSGINAKWVKAIDAGGALVRIWPLQAKDLPAWINARLAQAGLSAERDAVLQMARRVEGNLLAAKQEIDKLAMLYPGQALTVEQIGEAMGDNARFDVFLLADEALSGRAQRALRMLRKLQQEGVVPVLVLWSIVREVRLLAGMRDAMDAGASFASASSAQRVWKTRQPLLHSAVERQDAHSLASLLVKCEQADAAAKGRLREDPWRLLTEIVFQIATGRALMSAA
ncbi:MAG: DNA polymerase III subunit delta [Pseudomonadota bacterium]